MFLNQLCVSIFIGVAASVSAFHTAVPCRTVVSRQRTAFTVARTTFLHMSDTEEITAANGDTTTTPLPELTAEEEAAASAKRKIQRERHTLFVGNLPFGMFDRTLFDYECSLCL
jgi:hypothetical protein